MINKKIQSTIIFIMALSTSVNAAQQGTQQAPAQSPLSTQQGAGQSKGATSSQEGGTYKDEVEIIKFDENTGRDSYAIPFDEDALEVRQPKPSKTK